MSPSRMKPALTDWEISAPDHRFNAFAVGAADGEQILKADVLLSYSAIPAHPAALGGFRH